MRRNNEMDELFMKVKNKSLSITQQDWIIEQLNKILKNEIV